MLKVRHFTTDTNAALLYESLVYFNILGIRNP
jgi:lipoprotein NlpI